MQKCLLHIAIILIAAFKSYAQTYDFRNYNVEDGLSQSQVLCLYQDKFGAIWMGTNGGGASRYDGHHFYSFSAKDSLIDNVVFSVDGNEKGEIFLATNGGLSVYNGIKMRNYTEANGLTHNRIFKVLKDRSGRVWLGTGKGVCLFENGNIKSFNVDSTLAKSPVFTIYEDNAGQLWFGTISSGLFRCKEKNGKWFCDQLSKSTGLPENFVRSFGEDHQGNILAGTVAGIVMVNAKMQCKALNISRQENIAFISQTRDEKNNIWLGTDNGVFKWSPTGNYSQYSVKNGLSSNVIISTLVDREGNIWLGTDGSGVAKLSGEAFVNYSQRDSLPGDYISAAFADSKGNYWVGIKNSGVVKISNGKLQKFKWDLKSKNCLADNEVSDIEEDTQGNILFATKEGLSIYDGIKFKNYFQKDGLPSNNIYSLFKDNKEFWIGTKSGAARFDGNSFYSLEALDKVKGENDFPVFCFERDNENNLWLGTEFGVYIYNGKEINHFGNKDGIAEKRTVSIKRDFNGGIWIGTVEGLFYYDGKKFSHYSESGAIASNKIYFLQIDKQNNLWIGTNKGLDKVDINYFYKEKQIKVKHYGKEEGLKGLECNLNACYEDPEGKLLFGTIKGLTVYNPRFDRVNNKEALLRLTNLRLSFEKFDFSDYSKGIDSSNLLPNGLVLPYNMNHLTFDFVSVCITNPSKVKYQYKLEGIDPDWVPPTAKNEATYPALPPGKYTFHIKSMNNDGLWNEVPITFQFEILPPWYKTWWFYTLCAIAVLSGVYFYNSYKTKKLTEANIKLENTVEERTRELREEKEKVEQFNQEIVEQKAIIETKNRDITDSIKYAKNIQEALLPSLQILKKALPESFVLYMPKDIVSGDFYWFANKGGKYFFASVDCTGHGVPGAFMSIIGNSLLNEIVTEQHIYKPGEILDHLHAGVKEALNQNKGEFERRDGMDIALCAYNPQTNELEYAGANRPLWLFRNNANEMEIIKANKFPIGGLELEESRTFTNHLMQVSSGDTIYVFSDGYADQFGGGTGKKFMVKNMQKLIAQIKSLPMNEQYSRLQNEFLNWRGEFEQVDDVLVIGARIK